MAARGLAAVLIHCLIAAVGFAAQAPASPRLGRVKGSVVNRSGHLIPAAEITFEGRGVGREWGYTEDGTYQMELPSGVYFVTLKSDGYRTLRRQRVRVRAGSTATINFTLEEVRRRATRVRARRGA
jgi:hypothetical protein